MSSYQANSAADYERLEEFAAMNKGNNTSTPPWMENSPNTNNPVPMKDGKANPPMKDGSANAPVKRYGTGDASTGAKPAFKGGSKSGMKK